MSEERPATGGMALDAWLELVGGILGGPTPPVGRAERALLLDLARIAARRCERVAAPITTYLVGTLLAALGPEQRVARLERLVRELEATA